MEPVRDKKLSLLIKEKASDLGFDLCGIAKAEILSENGKILEKWCSAGMNADMSFLGRNIEKRINPGLVLPGAQSVVVTGMCYCQGIKQKDPQAPLLSVYTYGLNYHDVITARLKELLRFINTIEPDCHGRIFCDTGPLLEKAWAVRAGLGWQGRHSLVINKDVGSFFFIGALVLDIRLDYDTPVTADYCGDCRACTDCCPTGAINEDRTIDARKCISNLTVENKGPIPEDIIPKLGGRVFGCDICQQVCPWNKPITFKSHPEFAINEEIAAMSRKEWMELTEERYSELFKNTVIERVKYNDLMRNIKAAVRSMEQENYY